MNSGVKNIDKISVTELFQDSYVVPIYQRPFAWGKTEIDRLLDDIKGAEGNYYLGVLVVDEKNDGSKKKFEVIDGQQRLTTLFLIESFLNQSGSGYRIENPLLYEAREKYKEALSNPDKCHQDAPEINTAYEIIKSYFENADDQGKIPSIDDFKKKLREHIFIVRVQVPKGVDLNHYFEIMNTRGEQLELHQIAKSKILHQIKKEERFIASIIWDSCSDMDSYVQMNFGTDLRKKLFGGKWDQLIEHEKIFTISASDSPNKPKAQAKGSTDTQMSTAETISSASTQTPDVKDQTGEIKAPLKSSEPDFQKLGEIIKKPSTREKKQSGDNENKGNFESILSFSNFLLQVNLVRKYADAPNDPGNNLEIEQGSEDSPLDDSKLLEKLKYLWQGDTEESREEKAKKFVIKMLRCRLLFDRYILKRDYSDGTWSLKKLKEEKGKAVYASSLEGEDNTLLRTLQSALRITYTSPKSMRWINVVLEHMYNDGKASELISKLEEYCRTRVVASKYEEKSGFNIERIVFSYLDYLLYRDGYSYPPENSYVLLEKRPPWEFQFRSSIEHFFPQNPDSTKVSTDEIKSWTVKDESNDFKDALNNFGNLALITVESNSELSNHLPASKIILMKGTGNNKGIVDQSHKLKIMVKITAKKGWTPDIAKEHGKQMLAILREDIKKSFPNVVEQKLEQPNEVNASAPNNSQTETAT